MKYAVNLLTGKFSVDSRTNNLSIPNATLSKALKRRKQNFLSELYILVQKWQVKNVYLRKCLLDLWLVKTTSSTQLPLVHFFFSYNVTRHCFAGNERKFKKKQWLSLTVPFSPHYNKFFILYLKFISRTDQNITIMWRLEQIPIYFMATQGSTAP